MVCADFQVSPIRSTLISAIIAILFAIGDFERFDVIKLFIYAECAQSARIEKKEVREPGLEPGSGRWQRPIVPLDHSRCINGPLNF